MAIGGLSNDGDADRVEMSVEYNGDDIGLPTNIAPLITPRSGHGCTVLNTPDLSVLVSGALRVWDMVSLPWQGLRSGIAVLISGWRQLLCTQAGLVMLW